MKNLKDTDRHAFPRISSAVADPQRTTDEECAGHRCAYKSRPVPFILAEGCTPTRPGVVRTPFILRSSRLSPVPVASVCINIYIYIHVCVCTYIYPWNPEISNRVVPDAVNSVTRSYKSHIFFFRGIDRFFSGLRLYPIYGEDCFSTWGNFSSFLFEFSFRKSISFFTHASSIRSILM